MISQSRGCSGSIQISGAKNASLPLMAACLLTDKKVVLQNVPKISDIDLMKKQLESYGVQVNDRGSRRELHATSQTRFSPANSDGCENARLFSSFGPTLSTIQEQRQSTNLVDAKSVENGRPVNYHIKALRTNGRK